METGDNLERENEDDRKKRTNEAQTQTIKTQDLKEWLKIEMDGVDWRHRRD